MFALAKGALGEILYPPGLLILDISEDYSELVQEARRLSALSGQHYRVIQLVEVAEICQPRMQVIDGEGQNPIPADKYAEMRAEAREAGRKAREKEKNK